jgi:hypothetical protein
MPKDINNEVLIGGNRRNGQNKGRQPGITGIDFWEGPFSNNPTYNDLEKILEFPKNDDFAGQLSRGVFKNEGQRIAMVELIDLCEKYGLERHKNLIRNNIASTLGWYGFGKILQAQLGTGMMVPGVIREQLQMKKVKTGEDVQRSSDFRSEGQAREVDTRHD